VERSAEARAAHAESLASHLPRLVSSSADVPEHINGVLFANELLDAFPVHLVEMGVAGLSEIYVDLEADRLVERPGPPSTPRSPSTWRMPASASPPARARR